jgi:hypothetical protein
MAITVLQEPKDLSFSKDPIYFLLRTDEVAQPNIRIYIKVKIYNETLASYQDVAPPMSLIPDINGDAVFRIESLLDDFIDTFFPVVPDIVTSINCPQFIIEYAESFGEPPVIQSYTQSNEKFILRGGLNVGEYDTVKYFSDIPRSYLSTYSDTKVVAPNSIDYLYFLLEPIFDTTEIQMKVAILMNNGDEFIEYTDKIAATSKRQIVRFSAGFYQLGLQTLYPPDEVYSYTCYIIEQNFQRISAPRYFTMDTYLCDSKFFIYENSKGGMDSLTATGKNSSEIEISKRFAEKHLAYNYTSQGAKFYNHGSTSTYNTSYSEIVKSSVGYKNCDEVNALKDFLLSEKVWEYKIKDGIGKFFPVVVTTQKQTIYDDLDRFEHAFEFEFRYAFDYPVLQMDLSLCECCKCCEVVPMPAVIPVEPDPVDPPPPPVEPEPELQRLPCNTTIGSAGFGIKEWYVDLQSGGGVICIDVDSLLMPSKFEIWHNGIRVATSGMTVSNSGPFDTNDNYPSADQFINTSKGVIPTRAAAFLAANGYNQAVQFKQLLWFKYTAAQVAQDNRVIVRAVNPQAAQPTGNYKLIQHCPT